MEQTLTENEKVEKTIDRQFRDAPNENTRKKLADTHVKKAAEVLDVALALRNAILTEGHIPEENRQDAIDLDTKIRVLLQRKVVKNAQINDEAKAILQNIQLNQILQVRIVVAPMIIKIASIPDYIRLQSDDENDRTDFEKDYFILCMQNSPAAKKVMQQAILKAAETNKLRISKNALEAKLLLIDQEAQNEKNKQREQIQKNTERQAQTRERMNMNQYKDRLLEYFPDSQFAKERRLIKALYGEESEFWDYMSKMYTGKEEETIENWLGYDENGQAITIVKATSNEFEKLLQKKYRDRNIELPTEAEQLRIKKELLDQMVSTEFKKRVSKIIGQLYSTMDKNNPRITSDEALRAGDPFFNIGTLTENFYKVLNTISSYQIPKELEQMVFYNPQREIVQVMVPAKQTLKINVGDAQFEVSNAEEKALLPAEYLDPRVKQVVVPSFASFMGYVRNAAQTEVGHRKFFHDVRALPYLDLKENSYWHWLKSFAEKHLKAEDIDNLHLLYDGDEIMVASTIWDKLNELAYARTNWIHRPLVDLQDPASKETITDIQTRRYITELYRARGYSDWEINRIVSTGIADNYGITLRALTVPAQADAPRSPDGKPTLQSYGPKDQAIIRTFNLQAHERMRWPSETSQWGILMHLLVEGRDLREFAANWDYRQIFEQQAKWYYAFERGLPYDDYINKRVQFADIINIGRVGSIYDLAGWRPFFTYEGWLVRESENNILESWKALENIGVEVLKNYVERGVAQSDKNFFNEEKGKEKRKQLVTYLYEKYFVNPEYPQTPEDKKKAIDELFQKLETPQPDMDKAQDGYAPKLTLEDSYNAFFYRTLTRAIAQRIPTKFLRIESERRRSTVDTRPTNLDAVFYMARNEISVDIMPKEERDRKKANDSRFDPQREAYYQALQDIMAYGEALLRRDATGTIKEELRYNDGALHKIQLGNYNLTPERMKELWEKYEVCFDPTDENRNQERMKNALAVLKATRTYLFDPVAKPGEPHSYLDTFAEFYGGGIPYKPPFAIAVEELERSLLAHAASGPRLQARALDDIVGVDEVVVNEISNYYKVLREASIDGKHDLDTIVKSISKARGILSSQHGSDVANQVVHWMARITIAFFKKNAPSEDPLAHPIQAIRQLGEYNSLAAFIANARPGEVWEWDRVTIKKFIELMVKKHKLPFFPYKSNKEPKYESLYKLQPGENTFQTDRQGKLKESRKKRRVNDFDFYAKQLYDQYLNNPFREILQKIAPYALILIITAIIAQMIKSFKSESGEK